MAARTMCVRKLAVFLAALAMSVAGCTEKQPAVPLSDRLEGMLFASAAADAMGGPHEGRSTAASQKFLVEGGWLNTFDPYSHWYQSHWNVFPERAAAGTYTDDSRLRLFIAESMVMYNERNDGRMTRDFLAGRIFYEYRKATENFESIRRGSEESEGGGVIGLSEAEVKEAFLNMWYYWELAMTATEVYIPEEPPVISPGYRRVEEYDEGGERTGHWHLEKTERHVVDRVLKGDFNFGVYNRGEESALGEIALLPLAAYFPGAPGEAFEYVLEIDFFDIGNADLYPAILTAVLADLLSGKNWSIIAREMTRRGVRSYLSYKGERNLDRLDVSIRRALDVSRRFRVDMPREDKFTRFVKTLHDNFALGEVNMCTVDEMLSVSLALFDYADGEDLNSTIEMAVNYGRDNDTVAAMVAMLAGARHGVRSLNPDWRALITDANPGVDIAALSESLNVIADAGMKEALR